MLRISIPEPCREKWDQMTPVEKGAFCGSCKKIVTDFSRMTDAEILHQFNSGQLQSSCGRFRKSQLNRPILDISPEVLTMNIPLWKKFLAALFICFSGFLTSCENKGSSLEITEAVAPASQQQSPNIIATQSGDLCNPKYPTKKKVNTRAKDFFPIDMKTYGFVRMETINYLPLAPDLFQKNNK